MSTRQHNPTPWRIGKAGSVVCDTPVPEIGGADHVEYYGGHLVCESVEPSNAEFIVRACNSHEALTEACRLAIVSLEYHGIYNEALAKLRLAAQKAGAWE